MQLKGQQSLDFQEHLQQLNYKKRSMSYIYEVPL